METSRTYGDTKFEFENKVKEENRDKSVNQNIV